MICAFVDLLGNFGIVSFQLDSGVYFFDIHHLIFNSQAKNGNFGSTWNINTNVVKPMSPENLFQYLNSPFLQVWEIFII